MYDRELMRNRELGINVVPVALSYFFVAPALHAMRNAALIQRGIATGRLGPPRAPYCAR